MSVGFPFVGNTIFRRYIGRKNKNQFADGFTDGNCVKKSFPLEIYRRILARQ